MCRWASVDPEWNWFARDNDDSMYFYAVRPYWDEEDMTWLLAGNNPDRFERCTSIEWWTNEHCRDSLLMRPET